MAQHNGLGWPGKDPDLREEVVWLQTRVEELRGESNRNRSRAAAAEAKVKAMGGEMAELSREFRSFAGAVTRLAAMTEGRILSQQAAEQLGREFSRHGEVREALLNLLRSENEPDIFRRQAALALPLFRSMADRYWLASAALAYSAWKHGDRDEAELAVREAVLRDDPHASLFFFLLAARHGRGTSPAWLTRYLLCQRVGAMDPEAAEIFLAACEGAFGAGGRRAAIDAARVWLSCSGEAGADPRWREIILSKALPPDEEAVPPYSSLREYSPSWDALRSALEWVAVQKGFAAFYRKTLEEDGPGETASSVPPADVDEGLRRLVGRGPAEERRLARDVLLSRLIVEENGDLAAAAARLGAEWPPERPAGAFSDLAADLLAGRRRASPETIRLVLALSRTRLEEAYQGLREERLSAVPERICLKIRDWEGDTARGENESDLRASFSRWQRENESGESAVEPIWKEEIYVLTGLATGLVSMAAARTIIVPLAALGGYGYFVHLRHKQKEAEREEERRAREEVRKEQMGALSGCIAECASLRRELAAGEREWEEARDALDRFSLAGDEGGPAVPEERGVPPAGGVCPDWDLQPPAMDVQPVRC